MAVFDLAAALAGAAEAVSEPDTGRKQIVYVPLEHIWEDENNFYELSGIEELAMNIGLFGLMDPLVLRPIPEQPEHYRVISGHRRRAALNLLRQEDSEKWAEVPCVIENTNQSPALQELMLIFANKDNRKLSSADLNEQAQRVEDLLYQLQEQEGFQFPGRMRDRVAEVTGLKQTKLAKLKVIRDKLHPCWKPLYSRGTIPEEVAYELARMPEKWQVLFYDARGKTPSTIRAFQVEKTRKKLLSLGKQNCDRGYKCLDNRPRVEAICRGGCYYDCCADCYNLVDCDYSCPGMDALKAQKKADIKAHKAAEKAKEKKRLEPIIAYAQGVYDRWGQAKRKAGISTEEYIRACGRSYYASTDKEFDRYEQDPKRIRAEHTKLPFATNIWPSDGQKLCAAADALGVSLDWLLGRDVPPVNEPQVRVENCWIDYEIEKPKDFGEYAVLVRWSRGQRLSVDKFEWMADAWRDHGSLAEELGVEVRYWLPLPEEE